MVLLCIDRAANVLPHFQAAPQFGINVLSASQKELSMRFATRGQDRFEGVAWRTGEGPSPILAGALAYFECVTRQVWEAGDHLVFLGEVIAAQHDDGAPLIYYGSAYRELVGE